MSLASDLTGRRVRAPEAIREAWLARRPGELADDGRLMILAVDHPARGMLGVRDDSNAMASRVELLERLAAALSRPGVDGVLGTADILEDLLLLGLLDGRAVFGSMNRGGLHGSEFELDDRWTGYDVATIAANGLDGGKMLTRISLQDASTASMLERSGRAVTDLANHGRVAMVEPFLSRRLPDGRLQNLLDPDSVIKSIQIASGLGASSAYTWLKVPVVDQMERVLQATTLPTLLLGGDPTGEPDGMYASWARALAQPAARGLVVGRAMLYPIDGDPAAAVDTAVSLVHGGA